jgi:hypothetical protein
MGIVPVRFPSHESESHLSGVVQENELGRFVLHPQGVRMRNSLTGNAFGDYKIIPQRAALGSVIEMPCLNTTSYMMIAVSFASER